MINLHFGVIDIPYEEGRATTGDVAEFLEARYKIMQTFFDLHQQEIAAYMSLDLAGAVENLLAGAPPNPEPLAEAMDKIHHLFVKFIDTEEMRGAEGVPTKAALLGVSKRFKRRRGPRRASFYDSGTYEASFRAWVSGVINAVD